MKSLDAALIALYDSVILMTVRDVIFSNGDLICRNCAIADAFFMFTIMNYETVKLYMSH
jgi:hypothetical protein